MIFNTVNITSSVTIPCFTILVVLLSSGSSRYCHRYLPSLTNLLYFKLRSSLFLPSSGRTSTTTSRESYIWGGDTGHHSPPTFSFVCGVLSNVPHVTGVVVLPLFFVVTSSNVSWVQTRELNEDDTCSRPDVYPSEEKYQTLKGTCDDREEQETWRKLQPLVHKNWGVHTHTGTEDFYLCLLGRIKFTYPIREPEEVVTEVPTGSTVSPVHFLLIKMWLLTKNTGFFTVVTVQPLSQTRTHKHTHYPTLTFVISVNPQTTL